MLKAFSTIIFVILRRMNEENNSKHYSGYVNIIGNPNVGKSTLMNALLGDKLSIITSKPQTTRHRILGIWNDDNNQIIFSDSPGIIDDPQYQLHKRMNDAAFGGFEDADILLFVTDIYEQYTGEEKVIENICQIECPKVLIVNKVDMLKDPARIEEITNKWSEWLKFDKVFTISAKEKTGIDELLAFIRENMPEGPEYYPKDQLSDRTERFFVSEMIREQILLQYKQEIPYSSEVEVMSFKEGEAKAGPIIRIQANIYVERPNQKNIIIGKNGSEIKKLGISSRARMEEFFQKNIHLELHVSVKEDWRRSERSLDGFGY